MKKYFILFYLLCSFVYGQQVPQSISHRGVAYNTDGTIVNTHAIKIRVTITDNSPNPLLYSEQFSKTTNQYGQYSLNIGTGTPISPFTSTTFSNINWRTFEKFITIEIDPLGGSNFTLVGTNQLTTVPFAFYAQNVNPNNSLRVVNNISELRNIVGANFGEVIYIKGHTTQGDGGGGNFIWSNHDKLVHPTMNILVNGVSQTVPSPFYNDNDGTIIQAKNDDGSLNDSGRWVRQFDGYIDIRYFGIPFTGGTQRLQKAIDFASYNANIDNPPTRGATIFFPSGSWVFDKIILRTGVSIIGDSSDKTIIYSTNSSDSEFTNNPYLFEMEKGPIHINISNLKIIGRDTSKGCFYFNADLDGVYNYGGLTNSSFKNIIIKGFNGNAIYLRSEGGNKVNQLSVFENVYVNRQTDTSNALKIEGYAGQLTFLNCGFSGNDPCQGCPIRYNTGASVDIKNIVDSYATTISFINSTFASTDYGINISFAENITIDNCWFENTGIAINVNGVNNTNPSKSINILNNRFSNASGFGSLAVSNENTTQFGRCINIINSFVNILNNYVQVTTVNSSIDDDYFVMVSGNEGVNLQGNSFQSPRLNRTEGIMPAITQVVGNTSLNCKKNKLLFVNSSVTVVPSTVIIKEIVSDVNVGETIFLRANGGNISFWDASKTPTTPPNQPPGPGRNIFLSQASTAAPNGILTLKNGEAAVFTKIYDQQYQLTSIIRSSTQ